MLSFAVVGVVGVVGVESCCLRCSLSFAVAGVVSLIAVAVDGLAAVYCS